MEKKLYLAIIGIFLMVNMLSMVSAAPPTNIEFVGTTGLDIQANVFNYYKVNEGAEVHIYVFNKSDGNLVGSPTVNCTVELVDANGTVVVAGYPTPSDRHFHMSRPPSAVSETGVYGLTIVCNTTLIAGYKTAFFEATPTGTEFTTPIAIFYAFIFLLVGVFLFLAVSGMRNSEGSWLIFYICLSYLLIYVLMGVGYLAANDYLWATPILATILYIVWFVMGIGFLPFVIVISLYILGQEARAALEGDLIKQGHSPEEARELSKKHKRL